MTEEELEDKAKEYADKQIGCGDGYYEWTDVKQAYLDGAEPREKRIEELEKENAELKGFIMQSKKDGISPINALIIKNLADQLTKAKEIIKDLLNLPFASNEEVFADVGSHLYKAEQFLNEVEK